MEKLYQTVQKQIFTEIRQRIFRLALEVLLMDMEI